MLRPSYTDLLEVLNKDSTDGNAINSRYTIVIAAAKRARQIVDHADILTTQCKIDKPVSIAVEELFENKIKIIQPEEKNDTNNSLENDAEQELYKLSETEN